MTLENFQNTNYIGEIKIGSSKQKIRALFDTGSANSWVLSTQSKNEVTEGEHHFYFDEKSSKTWIDTGEAAKIYFGSGDLEGEFGKDTFWIPQGRNNYLKVEDQTFGLVLK